MASAITRAVSPAEGATRGSEMSFAPLACSGAIRPNVTDAGKMLPV